MKTFPQTSTDARCKANPFPFSGMAKITTKQPPGQTLTYEQIVNSLNAKVPPIAKAAKLLYPHLSQLSATAKLHGKIRYAGTRRRLTEQEQERLSAIILQLRSF